MKHCWIALLLAGCSSAPATWPGKSTPWKAKAHALPGTVDGKMTASGDNVIEQGTIPATWATAGEGGAKSYTMGSGVGGQVDLSTELGDITIVIK